MGETNLCAILYGIKDLRIENRPVPQASAGDLQIRVRAVGLCGSDVWLWKTAAIGGNPLTQPVVIGHEPCGTVSAVGPHVTGFAVGDFVAMDPNISCGACELCQEGRPNLCERSIKMASPPTHGAVANFIVWPARLCYKLPANVTSNEGAFAQPLAVAVHGCQRAGVRPGHRVLICGAGPLGMSMLQVARVSGASQVCLTDINEKRLQFLAGVTGCSTVHVQTELPECTAERVKAELGGFADVSIDTSAAAAAMATAIYATKPGGCVLEAGISPTAETQIPLRLALRKEVDIKCTFRFANEYRTAVQLISTGAVDVKPLVKHTFALEQTADAFEAAARGEAGKIVIQCSRE